MAVLVKALQDLTRLPRASQRAVGAIMGAIVADAATRPFHWVYKQENIEEALSQSSDDSLVFWPVSRSPFYNIPTGRRSCYSDECVCMLHSLPSAASTSPAAEAYSIDSYTQQLKIRFGPDSDYAQALAERKLQYDGSQRLTHADPMNGPWQNQSVTTFLATGEGERSIDESDGMCGAIPLVVWLAAGSDGGRKREDGMRLVQSAIQTLSASASSVEHAMCVAHLLHRLVAEESCQEEESFLNILLDLQTQYCSDTDSERDLALHEEIQAALDANQKGEEHFVASVAEFGKACAFPGSFQGSLLTVLSSTSFRDGVEKNLRGGGCNCSRANMAGALLGARWGVELGAAEGGGEGERGVPVAWIEQTEGGGELFALVVDKFR